MPSILPYRSMDDCTRAVLALHRKTQSMFAATAATFILSDGKSGPQPRKPAGKMHPNMILLNQLQAQAVSIGDVAGQIRANFPNEPGSKSLLETLDKMLVAVKAKVEAVRKDVAKHAQDRVDPDTFKVIEAVEAHLEEKFKGQYGTIGHSVLIGPAMMFKSTDTVNTSIGYVKITDLKGSDGFVHPLTYILIGIPDLTTEAYYVATSTEFKTPDRIRWEAGVSKKKDIVTVVDDLLVQDGMISKAFARDLPIPKTSVKLIHDAIERTTVDKGSVTVKIKPKYDLEVVRNALQTQLLVLVRQIDPRNKDVLRNAINPKTRTIKFVFSLPKRLAGRVVSDSMLNKIARLVGDISPEEMQRLKTALENPQS